MVKKINLPTVNKTEHEHYLEYYNEESLNIVYNRFKKDFIAYLDQLNPRAESIGSINCIHSNNGKLIGNNTDWFGFGQSLRDFNNFDNVIILGGGGVVPAVLYYFETRNNFSIHIIGRNLKKIECFEKNNISIYDFNNFDLNVENSIIINTIPNHKSYTIKEYILS